MHQTVHLINIMRLNITNAQPENPFTNTSQNIYCWKVTSKKNLDRTVKNIYIPTLLAVWTQTWMSANLKQGFPNWDFYMDLFIIKK